MAETSTTQSPLSRLARAGAALDPGLSGVSLAERAFLGKLVLRGDAGDPGFLAAVQSALGFDVPVEANRATGVADISALWLGPDEWLVVTVPGRESALAIGLKVALTGRHAAVTDVSDARTVIRLSGRQARDVLAKGCPLDLHPRNFGPGQVAQSVIARAGAIIHQIDDSPSYDIYVLASFAAYLWNWLTDAAVEYGLTVRE